MVACCLDSVVRCVLAVASQLVLCCLIPVCVRVFGVRGLLLVVGCAVPVVCCLLCVVCCL